MGSFMIVKLADGCYPFVDERLGLSEMTMVEAPPALEALFKAQAERAFLLSKLRAFDWNVSETARALDMPRSNLYKKIERYGLTRES